MFSKPLEVAHDLEIVFMKYMDAMARGMNLNRPSEHTPFFVTVSSRQSYNMFLTTDLLPQVLIDFL